MSWWPKVSPVRGERSRRIWIRISGLGLGLGCCVLHVATVIAKSETEPEPSYIREAIACPANLDTLTAMLLRDLPSYANRVTQRLYPFPEEVHRPGHIVLASLPDDDPLTLGPGLYVPAPNSLDHTVAQIFFTTLERQYLPDRVVNFQYHHWLFLTQTEQDWRMVTLVSQLATVPEGQILSPPEDTGQGIIAQAVQLWLRDCRNQAVDPPAPLPEPASEADNG